MIVGVHSPEFEFEKKLDNVNTAVKKFGIMYPVVLDNNYTTWAAYANQYWPHKYLIGIDGRIIYDHIGEGGYEETEKQIQAALKTRMVRLGIKDTVTEEIQKPANTIDIDFSKVMSPETYFGSGRNQNLGNGRPLVSGSASFTIGESIDSNVLYLGGEWGISDEFAENKTKNARIVFRYNAKNVYLVANAIDGVKVKIFRDGKLVKETAGEDVAKDGTGVAFIHEDRLYRLIEGESYGLHILQIDIESPGLRAFTFTFG